MLNITMHMQFLPCTLTASHDIGNDCFNLVSYVHEQGLNIQSDPCDSAHYDNSDKRSQQGVLHGGHAILIQQKQTQVTAILVHDQPLVSIGSDKFIQ